jgi:hypothetical protein
LGSTAGFGVEQPAMATDASSSMTFKQAIFMAVLRQSYEDGNPATVHSSGDGPHQPGR